jgi:hypothetical protein
MKEVRNWFPKFAIKCKLYRYTPGPVLNGYTHAALGALATISIGRGGRRRSLQWGSSRGGLSRNSSGGRHSGEHFSRGGRGGSGGNNSNRSSNSAGSRGSGAAAHFKLREVLESTPGWDMEHMTFLSQPDVPWLHMRLVDLNDELKLADAAKLADEAREAALGESLPQPPEVGLPPASLLRPLNRGFVSGPLPTLSSMHDPPSRPSSPFSPALTMMGAAITEGGGAGGPITGVKPTSNLRSSSFGKSSNKNIGGSGGSGGGSGGGGGDSGGDGDSGGEAAPGFEEDMRQALDAATAARNLVAEKYGMTRATASAAIGHMASMVPMDETLAQAEATKVRLYTLSSVYP